MRILMLSQFYPPIIGGEEQHVRHLSTELVARGHHVTVATLWHKDLATFEQVDSVHVHRIRSTTGRVGCAFQTSGRRYAPPAPDPEAALALRDVVARDRPQIVHAHDWLGYSFLPWKSWSHAQLVVTLHNYGLACAKTTLMYHGMPCSGPHLAKCLRCVTDEHYGAAKGVPITLCNWVMGGFARQAVDMFLPVSHAVADGNDLARRQVPYQVIPNFIPDDASMSPGESESYLAQLPPGEFLLYVGALGRFKGVDVLLRAYSTLRDAPPLVVIGYSTPDFARVATDGLRNVVILRDWPHSAVMEAWRRSALAVVPSVWPEPFGLVALEAMSAGRPVIASRIGGLTDIVVDGETGYLVPPNDVSALREAMAHLLADQALRERMGDAARRRAREFRASRVVPRIEQMYRQMLHRQDGPALTQYEASSA